jgi:hypothetical protein
MKYLPSPQIQAELVRHGLEQFCSGIELNDQELDQLVAEYSAHPAHEKESAAEILDRAAYFLIWRDYGVPQTGKAAEDVTAKRITVMHETLRDVAKQHFPKMSEDFAAVKENTSIQANAAKMLGGQFSRFIHHHTLENLRLRGDIRALESSLINKHSEALHAHTDLAGQLEAAIKKIAKITFWGFLSLALLLLLNVVLSLRAHAQIDVIQFQDSTGTIIKTFAAPFKIKCSTNLTCTASGSTLTMVSAAGGSGTPGGSDTQFQFNDAGAFGGVAGMTYIKASTLVKMQAGAKFSLTDTTDLTKAAQFDLSGIATATTRTGTVPNANFTFVVPFTCTNQVATSASSSGTFACTTITSAYTSGTFPASAHNLLSATHGDTTAAAAVRGDGIFAIGATPTWQRLAHSSATGGYFKWNGTDIVASTGAAAGTGACTNQVVTAENADAAPTCTTATLASAQFANQGTTTTVLHGNGAGNPAFGAVVQGDVTNGYVDLSTTQASIAGNKTFLGADNFQTVNSIQVVGVGTNTTIQAAITAASTTQMVYIPPTYAGTDSFTNPNNIPIDDRRGGVGSDASNFNVKQYGAWGDGAAVTNGAMATGSCTLTSASNPFIAGDVGKVIEVSSAGAAAGILRTTIATFVSAGNVTLTACNASGGNVASAYVNWGHDDTTAINSAITAACNWITRTGAAGNKGTVFFPAGEYMSLGGHTATSSCSGLWLNGSGIYSSRLVLWQSAASDLFTFNGVTGPPSGIFSLALTAATGGNLTHKCLALTGTPNGVFVKFAWLAACQYGLYVNGGSDISIEDVTSELNTENFYVTNTAPFRMSHSESYQAKDVGFWFINGPTATGTDHTYGSVIENIYDVESVAVGLMVDNYTDLSITNALVHSFNNQQPTTGIWITNSAKRIQLVNPRVLHTQQYGIRITGGAQIIDITNPHIDAVGNYAGPPAIAMYGIFATQGTQHINIQGGYITNIQGTCASISGPGNITGVHFIDCAVANSGTQGLYSLELGIANANASDTVFVTGNFFQNANGPRGTAIRITSGNNYDISHNYIIGSFATNVDNQTGGTNRSFCSNLGFVATCLYNGEQVFAPTTSTVAPIQLQDQLNPPPFAPTLTCSNTGGSLAAATHFFKIAFNNTTAGVTTVSAEASCATTGTTGSVVVTAPTLPTNATGYTVYDSNTTNTELTQAASGACVNISANCTVTTLAAGAAMPSANNASACPTAHTALFGEEYCLSSDGTTANNIEEHTPAPGTAGAILTYDSGGSNAITDTVNGTVTSYTNRRPLAAGNGVQFGVNASNVITQDFSGDAAHAVSQTAKTAAVTTFTVCAATAGTACGQVGQYRISYNFWGSGTACSAVTAGSVGLNLTWTDENAVTHTTVSMPMAFDQKSAAAGILFNFNTALGTEGASGSYIISTNGTIIQAATTYTACTTGTGTYNLRMTVEQLQ